MVDVMVFVECWYLVWWTGGLFISSYIMEYGLGVFKFSSRSRPTSGPRRSTSNLPPLNKIISLSRILSSISLFIWLFMTCVNNRLANLRVVNDFCLCVVRVRVCVGLCVGNDAIYLNVCSVLHDLSFSQSRWKIGKIMVIHINIIPFALVLINVCDYPMYLVCTFLYFWGCIANERLELAWICFYQWWCHVQGFP